MLVSRREVAPVYLIDSATAGLFESPQNIFLTESGNGTGTRNFNNNYSVTAKDIYYQAVTTFQLYSMQFSLTDAGQFAYDGYASNVALTNGVKFFFKAAGMAEVPLFNGVAVKTNADYEAMCSQYDTTSWGGSAQTAVVHIHFLEQCGCPLTLKTGDRIIIRLNDNFTGITTHVFAVGGKEVE